MDLQNTKEWLNNHLQKIVHIPESLVEHLKNAPQDNEHEPWWLAECIVKSTMNDEKAEGNIITLLQTIEQSVQNDTFMENLFEIVENVIDIMSCAFKTPLLKNSFHKDNAFITVYYVVVFVMSCALGEDREDSEILDIIRHYESIILSLASMANKLLLNNEVYEFVAETCISRGSFLC